MARALVLVYGMVCYAIFFGTFLYMIGWVGGFAVPHTIDSGEPGPLGVALLVDVLLIALFGVQHSVMARPGFKERWTRLVPRPMERSTYVLLTSLILMLIFWQWRPIAGQLWNLEGTPFAGALFGLYLLGVVLVLYSSFLIDHFDLFGLRQAWLYARGRSYRHKPFGTPALYRHIRHPLYVGWFLWFWATPAMSFGHLLFAALATSYILIAIPFEERDLQHFLGDDYRRWRERTPAFLPRFRGRKRGTGRPARAGSRL